MASSKEEEKQRDDDTHRNIDPNGDKCLFPGIMSNSVNLQTAEEDGKDVEEEGEIACITLFFPVVAKLRTDDVENGVDIEGDQRYGVGSLPDIIQTENQGIDSNYPNKRIRHIDNNAHWGVTLFRREVIVSDNALDSRRNESDIDNGFDCQIDQVRKEDKPPLRRDHAINTISQAH